MFPISSSFDSTDKKLLFQCHKETQTNFKNSSRTSQPTASDEGSITVLEINEILQDPTHPGEVTIIKDVFSEEIHDHGTQTPGSDARSNRYTYCREVIKPFLRDYPVDCPISDEQLIRDALLAAHNDYPDQQPCVEIYDGGSDIKNKNTDILDKDPNKENSRSSDNNDIKQSSNTCISKKNSKTDTDILDKNSNKENSQPSDNNDIKQSSKTCISKKNSKTDTDILDKNPNKENSQPSDSNDLKQASNTCISKKNSKSDTPDTGIVGSTKPIPSGNCLDKDIKSESSNTSTGGKPRKSKKCKKRRTKEKKEKKTDSSETNIKDNNINKSSLIVTDKSSKDSLQSNMSDDEECPRKKRDPKCPKVTRRRSIEDEVFRTGTRPPVGPPAICKNPSPAGLSTCKSTPTAETCEDKEDNQEGSSSKKKKKEDDPCSHKMESVASNLKSSVTSLDSKIVSKRPLSISEAHGETMATIKLAVEDFFGKIYQSTKEAVTVIRKESVRQICNLACENSESQCKIPPREVSDDHNENNPETGRFQFFHDLEGDLNDDPKDGGTSGGLSDKVQAVAGSILSKVDSTFSMLSNHVDVTIRSLNESSNPYDKTVEEAAEESNAEATGVSMFSSIKSRIISLFGESASKEVDTTRSHDSAGVTSNQDLNEKQMSRHK